MKLFLIKHWALLAVIEVKFKQNRLEKLNSGKVNIKSINVCMHIPKITACMLLL